MPTVLLAGKLSPNLANLEAELAKRGFKVVKKENIEQPGTNTKPDIALLDLSTVRSGSKSTWSELIEKVKISFPVPIIVFVTVESLDTFEPLQGADDFITVPYPAPEVEARIKQVLWQKQNLKSEKIIKRGDLVIDLSSYKVFLAGQPIDLTFKEYELLHVLAGNPGKVFSRDALLNQVWGYDYYGGDRTVDVHIRRLRSKVEDANHSFIETVWNVGYRFKV